MQRHPPIPRVNDTSAEAAEVQSRLLCAMPPSRKIHLVEDANRTARRLALAGIRLRFPGASTEQSVTKRSTLTPVAKWTMSRTFS